MRTGASSGAHTTGCARKPRRARSVEATPDDLKVLMLMRYPPFSSRMRLDHQQLMWDMWLSGKDMSVAAAVLGVDRKSVYNRVAEAGGIRPRRRQTRSRLSYEDRVHIEIGVKHKR